jgi:ParB/RepB/Spo0J family partition protein
MEIDMRIVEMPLASLKPDPHQPRKTFPDDILTNMASTIKRHGTINPIEVDEKNVIITGEIRWRAAKKAGIRTIPVKRIRGIAPEERLERQLVENYHQTRLTEDEGYQAIYQLHRIYEKKGKSKRNLTEALGTSMSTVDRVIDAIELQKRGKAKGVPVTAISFTAGLPEKDRLSLIESVKKGKYSTHELQEITPIVRKAPPSMREKVIKREIEPDRAKQMVEVYHEAPEPLKDAMAEEKVSLEHAKEAVAIYEELKKEGVSVPKEKIKKHVEELRRETLIDEAQAKLRRQSSKDILSGKKETLDLRILSQGSTFVQEVRDVAWRVKGWGVPNMMAIGADRWKEAQKYFKEIRDHMDFLLGKSPR